MVFPETLKSLILGDLFNRSLERTAKGASAQKQVHTAGLLGSFEVLLDMTTVAVAHKLGPFSDSLGGKYGGTAAGEHLKLQGGT